jgi:AcrR family transcriptional regulator
LGEFSGDDNWFKGVNVGALGDSARRAILGRLRDKLGFNEAAKALGVAKSSLYRYVSGQRRVPDEVVARALRHLSRAEFEEIVRGEERLRALGLVTGDGVPDYSAVLELLALAARDEYIKNALLRFVTENFREDLKKMLGISYAGVKLEWSEDFKNFLMERKKRTKIRDPETIKYYRNLFKKHLEGRELSEELIDWVARHPNGWLRNIFRHYIQYLYFRRRISGETMAWIMEVVPSRSYKLRVKAYRIDLEQFRRTMEYLRSRHELYYLYYLLMYYSGIRLEHVVKMVGEWDTGEVYVDMIDAWSPRLVCFPEKGFCRYYMGLREGNKPC